MDPAPAPVSREGLLRALPVAVAFANDDGIIVDGTDRIRDLLGWSVPELVGRRLSGLFPPPVDEALCSTMDRWRDEGTSPFDGRLVRLSVLTASAAEIEVGLWIHRSGTGFIAAFLEIGTNGEGLRDRLLDAVSEPDVTAAHLAAVADVIGRAFDWDLATVWVVDPQTATLRAAAVWERDPDPARRYRSATLRQPFRIGEGLPGQVWQGDQPLVTGDVSDDPRFGPGYGSNRLPQAAALVPLRSGHRLVGVIELLAHRRVDATLWIASESDAIGSGVGQLVERFREHLQVNAVEGRLALALDAGELGVWTLDVRSGLAEWSSRMAELHGVTETSGGADSLFASVVEEDRIAVGRALEQARESDATQTVVYRVRDLERGTSWLSTRVTRIQANGGPPVLSAVSSDATEQKRAELSLQRRRAAVEGLQWVSQAIIAGRQLTDTAIAVANAATGVLGADLGVVLYPEPGEVGSDLAWAVSGLPGDAPLPDPPRHLDLFTLAGAATGVQVVRDLAGNPTVRELVDSFGLPGGATRVRSVLLVPISGDRGRPLGLMLFAHVDRGYFTEDDARLAASIGSSTGVAIENARRHEEQRLAAVTFQRQLLPEAEIDVAGLEVCVRYHPGRDGLDVGGDWYDVIELGDQRVGLAVGDVCGHGLSAAAHMGQFRYSFRALLLSSSSPEEAFQVLNRMALQELATTVTIAYVELDTRTWSCAAWSCGHLPPVLAGPDGDDVRWIEDEASRGPMLGFLPSIDVRPVRTTLAEGETLLLYTDGLVERRGESIDEGLQRLAGAFRDRAAGLDDLCDELHEVLVVSGPDADDTVLLGIRRA